MTYVHFLTPLRIHLGVIRGNWDEDNQSGQTPAIPALKHTFRPFFVPNSENLTWVRFEMTLEQRDPGSAYTRESGRTSE